MKKIFCVTIVFCWMLTLSACSCKHDWKEATCDAPKTCSLCDRTEGDVIDHRWEEATCDTPKTCSLCGKVDGVERGHNWEEPVITKDATCSEEGIKQSSCSVCNETKETSIPSLAHTPGEWEIVREATENTKGKKAQKCSVCDGIIVEEEFEKSAAEIKADYILNCGNYTYNEISRNPENYMGKHAHFRGEIIQSIEDGDSYTFRVNVTRTSYGYTDTILVTYTKKEASESRILEDDIVDIYGMLAGTHTYETVMGNDVTIPLLLAEYIDIN